MSDLDLPADVAGPLADFTASAEEALGPDLVSVVLFGSAAEGRLRATSDVNLILVLARFDAARIDRLREPMRLAHATIRLSAMFLLDSEIDDAAEAFAVKFSDIRERHKVLVGKDPFAELSPSRASMLVRLRQILLNFTLRMRERYVLVSLREEQLVPVVADAAGPLRSAAALILSLEGRPAPSTKAALETLAAEIMPGGWRELLARLSTARETGSLPAGTARPAVLGLIELASAMRTQAETLS
jgi:predicted nucleotidyltransferase